MDADDESASVSFTTANGKEVTFKAKKGRAKASAKKKVVETPVTPQETEEPPAPPEAAPVAARRRVDVRWPKAMDILASLPPPRKHRSVEAAPPATRRCAQDMGYILQQG